MRRILLSLTLVLSLAAPTFAQELTPRAHAIIDAIYAQHRDLADTSDDTRRALMRTMAEQLVCELGPAWGVKSAGPGRPQGPSQLAYNAPSGLVGWRILDGDGSVTGTPNAPLPAPPIQSFAGQVFIAVACVDHLGQSPTPTQPSEPAATQEDHDAALHRIEAQLEAVRADLAALKTQSDQNTEKIQAQIDQVVKNAERSAPGFIAAVVKVLTLGAK